MEEMCGRAAIRDVIQHPVTVGLRVMRERRSTATPHQTVLWWTPPTKLGRVPQVVEGTPEWNLSCAYAWTCHRVCRTNPDWKRLRDIASVCWKTSLRPGGASELGRRLKHRGSLNYRVP